MAMVGMEGSLAMAEAARLANVDVVAAYPITPQTHIVERLAEMVANGELNAAYIPVESEHSAMSACLGSSATGARTFTATAGQGLELMHEVLYVASGMRLPIVMGVANRALSCPLSVWGDHSDVMAVRDTGWIQIFAENGQQAFDLTPVRVPHRRGPQGPVPGDGSHRWLPSFPRGRAPVPARPGAGRTRSCRRSDTPSRWTRTAR